MWVGLSSPGRALSWSALLDWPTVFEMSVSLVACHKAGAGRPPPASMRADPKSSTRCFIRARGACRQALKELPHLRARSRLRTQPWHGHAPPSRFPFLKVTSSSVPLRPESHPSPSNARGPPAACAPRPRYRSVAIGFLQRQTFPETTDSADCVAGTATTPRRSRWPYSGRVRCLLD